MTDDKHTQCHGDDTPKVRDILDGFSDLPMWIKLILIAEMLEDARQPDTPADRADLLRRITERLCLQMSLQLRLDEKR